MAEEIENTDNAEAGNSDENANVDVGANQGQPQLVTITRPDGTQLQVAATPDNYGVIQAFSNQRGMAGDVDPNQGGNINPSLAQINQGPTSVQPGASVGDLRRMDEIPSGGSVGDLRQSDESQLPQAQALANQQAATLQAKGQSGGSFVNAPPNSGQPPGVQVAGTAPGVLGGDGVETRQGGPVTGTDTQGGYGGTQNGLVPVGTESSTTRHILSPEESKDLADRQKSEKELVESAINLQTKQNQIHAADAQTRLNLAEEQNRKYSEFRKGVDDETKKRMDALDTETQKLSDMKIDPHHAFGEGVTPSKILAGIGIALGAIGQAHGGGPNQAISIIDNAIKRDIEVQKANIEKQRGVVEAKRGGLESYMKVANNKEIAMDAEYSRQLKWADAQLASMQSGIANDVTRNNIAQLRAGLAQKRLETDSRIFGATQTDATKYMAPQMMGKDLPESQSKLITENENTVNEYASLRNELKNNPKLIGAFTGRLNDVLRKGGFDDPDVTAFGSKLKNMLTKEAVSQGITRQSSIDAFIESQIPKGTDSPATADKLLTTKIQQHHTQAANARVQYGSGMHRMPNYPPNYFNNLHSMSNYNYLGGTVQPKPGM